MHRGGQVGVNTASFLVRLLLMTLQQSFQPLEAEVRLLPGASISFSSFTGRGYSLPMGLDDDYADDYEEDNDVYKDDSEEFEHPTTHKHYAEQEIDDEDVPSSPELDRFPQPLYSFPSYLTPVPFQMPGQFNPAPLPSFPQPSPWRLIYNYPEQPKPQQDLPYILNSLGPYSHSEVSPPPVLPPITGASASNVEVIDVDAPQDSDIIDVDALESEMEHHERQISVSPDSESEDGEGSEVEERQATKERSVSVSRSPSPVEAVDREADAEAHRAILANVQVSRRSSSITHTQLTTPAIRTSLVRSMHTWTKVVDTSVTSP